MDPGFSTSVQTVLVVEDNPGDARLVQAYLEDDTAGRFSCLGATTLAQALEILRTRPVDVVLLDLSLPDSFGLDSLTQVRACNPALPVVVLTGTIDEAVALDALRQGAQDYLVKGQGDGDLVRRAIRYAMGRSRADAALRDSEAKFRALFENAGAGVVLLDADGRYLHCNPAFCAMVGFSESDLSEKTLRDLALPEDRDETVSLHRSIIGGECDSSDVTRRYLHRDGSVKWGRMTMTPLRGAFGGPIRNVVVVVEDVTEKKRLEDHMRLAVTVFENTGEGLFVTDADHHIVHVNPAFTVLTGYQPDDVLGHTPRILSSGRHPPDFYDRMAETLAQTGRWQGEIWNRRKSGEMFAEWLNIAEVRDARNQICNFVAVFSDITSRKEDEERLSYQANHDPLTRLPNRTLFQERLSRALTRAHRNQTLVALLFIDLDFFKQVNDTFGHLAGDSLLQQVADRLTACVRQGDTVARLSGDEFTVILEDIAEARDSAVVAHKILTLLAEPFDLPAGQARISSSIGVALFPTDGGDAHALVKLADAAMYRAKHQGRNTCRFHSEMVYAQAFERLSLENALRQAVDQHQFQLYYQPVFAATTGKVSAVEALLRWHHPELGTIQPDHFLPLAEETGMIHLIGTQVLNMACREARSWMDDGIAPPRVCVNLSPRQFRSAELSRRLAAILAETGLPAAMLELDLPESCLTEKSQDTDRLFSGLKEIGVSLAIDDFGSGHSSFTLLRRLPTDCLKISQAFVRDAANGAENAEVITAIVAVARGLHMRVVAPGIETPEQMLSMTARYECDLLQGYLFARPMPAAEMRTFLRERVLPPALEAVLHGDFPIASGHGIG